MILDEVVDNARVSCMMLPDSGMMDEDNVSGNHSAMTMPSIVDEGYPG